jgi:hypothetical protein
VPTEYFVLANLQADGAVIGRLGDQPIPETVIDGNGLRYRYAGVAPRGSDGRPDVEALRPGEWIVKPGLVYLMEDDEPRRKEA